MKVECLNFIIGIFESKSCLANSDAQKKLLNTIVILAVKYYRTLFSNSREVCYAV